MDFIKTFKKRKVGRKPGIGSIRIADGFINIKLNVKDATIKEVGTIKDGIGVVLQESKNKKKLPYAATRIKYDSDSIPENFQGTKYRFRIPAERISDTEYKFLYCNAKMTNKK